MTFPECVQHCFGNKDFVREYDRLHGSNLAHSGHPLEVEVDYASGRMSPEMWAFIDFVAQVIWAPLVARVEWATTSAL